jgi:very-short-patch-repair endonuclease
MTSPSTQKLIDALQSRGIVVVPEYQDGPKRVDIFVPAAKLFIEVDGPYHYADQHQFEADLARDFYSFREGFSTKRIPNNAVDNFSDQIAAAVQDLIRRRDTSAASPQSK